MDRFEAARVFLETVARGSISAAAEHLGMSRAMASRYIGLMEEWSGTRLLHRTTRKLSLTTAGEEILPICKELLALSMELAAKGAHAEDAPKGLLRITTSSIFAEFCLADALVGFLKRYPATCVDLQIADRAVNLAEDGIDLAIRVTNSLDPNLIARKLGECASVICASPSYLKANGTPSHPRDLVAHNCITYAYLGQSVWRFDKQGESIVVPVYSNFSTNESMVVLRAALSGAGIAMLPEFAARQFLKDGKLALVFGKFEVENLGVYAVYLSRNRMPPALRALIDFLATELQRPLSSVTRSRPNQRAKG